MDPKLEGKIHAFFSKYIRKEYGEGEIVLHPDEDPNGAYYIHKGFVKEYGISLQGVEITFHIFVPGSFFPMMSVISNIKNRYYYEAISKTVVYVAPRDRLLEFLLENPDALLSLTDRLLKGLDKLTLRIEGFALATAYQKVISILLFLARHFGERKDKKVNFHHKFTHREIGALAGITRETTSREWEKLEKKGIINYRRDLIFIKDIDQLNKELTG